MSGVHAAPAPEVGDAVEVIIPFVTAASILFIGFLGEVLFRRTGLPSIPFLIVLGVVLGLLGAWVPFFAPGTLAPVTPYLTTLALIMILFHGGMEMNLVRAFGSSGRATLLAILYFVLVTVGVAVAARFLLGFDWTGSLLFGPMIAGTSSVVIIPLAARVGLREDTSTTIALESTITDILNIVVFFALVDVYYGRSTGLLETGRDIVARFGVGLLFGVVAGIAWLAVLYRIRREVFTYIPTLAVAIFLYFGSETFGGSGVLSVLTMGLALGNDEHVARFVRMRMDPKEFAELKRYLMRFQAELSFLIRAFFFVLLGLLFSPDPSTLAFSLAFGVLFVAINMGLRYVAVVASTVGSPMRGDRVPMTLLCGQGLAHATLAVIPMQLLPPQYPAPIANAATYPLIVVMVIIMTNMITAVGAVAAARRRPETAPEVAVVEEDPPPPPDEAVEGQKD